MRLSTDLSLKVVNLVPLSPHSKLASRNPTTFLNISNISERDMYRDVHMYVRTYIMRNKSSNQSPVLKHSANMIMPANTKSCFISCSCANRF